MTNVAPALRPNDAITDIGMSALVGAESLKLHAYSAFTLIFMVNTQADPKALRQMLSVKALRTGVIAKNTWESYVKASKTPRRSSAPISPMMPPTRAYSLWPATVTSRARWTGCAGFTRA